MNTPQQIQKLEAELGFPLQEVKSKEELMAFTGQNLYVLNEQQEIIKLYLRSNEIKDISFLNGLESLRYLDLWQNHIEDISPLNGLENLVELCLNDNRISDISPLNGLTNLVILDLMDNEIRDITPLKGLKNLKHLRLWKNQIEDIYPLNGLENLTTLGLSHNLITNIEPLIELESLTELSLSENQITDIQPLNALKNLTYLGLWNNQIEDIYPLNGLRSLTELSLSGNQISDIAFLKELKNLKSLKNLDLSTNLITNIESLIELNNLNALNLLQNEITNVSLSFLQSLPNLESLYLWDNPIKNIPTDIFNKTENVLKPVRDYLEGIENGATNNTHVKALFIGNGGVGKTQVAKRLAEESAYTFNTQHSSTHAIVHLQKRLRELDFSFWDFAGQEMYHATHRLFMKTRAIFILVWDIDSEAASYHTWEGTPYENRTLDYWLAYATHFAPQNRILIVQNKVDTQPQSSILAQAQKTWKEQYPNIIDFIQVSAQTGYNFDVLADWLPAMFEEDEALRTQLLQPIPTTWATARQAIHNLQAQGTQLLSLTDFAELLGDDSPRMDTILSFFHDTGVLYHRSGYFNSHVILDQAWIIHAVYRLLNRGDVYIKRKKLHENGRVSYEQLVKLWDTHTDRERELFIDFMLSAELCIETTPKKTRGMPLQERTFLMPHLLPTEKPLEVIEYWEKHCNMQQLTPRVLSYGFLPGIFMQLFIVRAYRFAPSTAHTWQQGILLQTDAGNAIVEADYSKKEITIRATSEHLTERIEEELHDIQHEEKEDTRYLHSQSRSNMPNALHENETFLRGLAALRTASLIYKQVRELVPDNQLEKALGILEKWYQNQGDTDNWNSVTTLQRKLKSVKEDKIRGTASSENISTTEAQITESILTLITDTENQHSK